MDYHKEGSSFTPKPYTVHAVPTTPDEARQFQAREHNAALRKIRALEIRLKRTEQRMQNTEANWTKTVIGVKELYEPLVDLCFKLIEESQRCENLDAYQVPGPIMSELERMLALEKKE
jgi:hypothetical protein